MGSEGTGYAGPDNSAVYAINPADGTRKWALPTTAASSFELAIAADGTVYAGSLDGALDAIR